MICSRCGKREAELRVGGRALCSVCARDEILARAKSILHQAGAVGWKKSVEVAIPKGWEPLKDVTSIVVKRSCYKCDMRVDVKFLESGDPFDAIWKLIMESRDSGKPVIAPFTSEFFSAFTLYSIIKGIHDYLVFSPPTYSYNGSLVVSPLSSTTIAELRAFGEFKLSFEDQLFTDLFDWLTDYFASSQEQARAYWRSYEVITKLAKKRCKVCGALITEGEVCRRCSSL